MNEHQVKLSLQQRLVELGVHREKLKAHLRQPGDPDWQEQATQRENDEVLEALEDKDLAEARVLQQAIARIDAGKYGVCEGCEGPIGEPRLEAIPWATHCVSCAE